MSTPRTLAALAKDALLIQDACNPLGLTKGFAAATQELRERLDADGLPSDTRAICLHPVFCLWASKMHDLACMGLGCTDRYHEVYTACKALVQAGERKEVA